MSRSLTVYAYRYLRVAVLASLVYQARSFHDDDCDHITAEADAVVNWTTLRNFLVKGDYESALPIAAAVVKNGNLSSSQCELGFTAVCVMTVGPKQVNRCTGSMPILRILASRWPIFHLLHELHKREGGNEDMCAKAVHPSIDWQDWLHRVSGFAENVQPWLEGQSGNDSAPPELDEALMDATAIVWKASSGAMYEGVPVSEWTNRCSFGVLAAHIIRGAGLIIGAADVYRIVERAMESAQKVFKYVEEVMDSIWPLFGVLHAIQSMKNALHDTQFKPDDFRPLTGESSMMKRSPIWKLAESRLRTAASLSARVGLKNTIFLTLVPYNRVQFLMNFFKTADKLGFLAPSLVIPTREPHSELCEEIQYSFSRTRAHGVPPPMQWNPCLPFVSMFIPRAQYIYLYMAIQLGINVLWFDFHVLWAKTPVSFVRGLDAGGTRVLSYAQRCLKRYAVDGKDPDIYVADEFYQINWVKNTLFFLRPTPATWKFIDLIARWLLTYPFAVVGRGLQYLVYPKESDVVPSVSFLPPIGDVPRLQVEHFNVEDEIVSVDGWFGDVQNVVACEITQMVHEDDRLRLLEIGFGDDPNRMQQILSQSRKLLSPLRPTQRLYDTFVVDSRFPVECEWAMYPNTYIGEYALYSDTDVFASLEEAKRECIIRGAECAGVTCENDAPTGETSGNPPALFQCTLRKGNPPLAESPYEEVSYVKQCGVGGDCDAPQIERIVHVNFADGCCEREQNQSSRTALQFGADESRPLRGDFLDADFREKNHVLLTFNRTPELTQHKTPSGKVGYYVWKPYVVLNTVLDPSLPWDSTVIAWTDAGIYFVGDMGPLIQKYMRFTDVAATRTPMMEGDFSKRDAFVLLEADYQTIMETNQVATGVILVRKTRLAVNFLQRWLKACEERRIMTEESSVLGFPEYPTYKNNNDDQTGFSLLFKRFGFIPFSVLERDEVVYTGRNLAKFIKASDDFAVGKSADQDTYLRAADEAAKQR